jgi:hypothetical protein
MTRSKTHGKIRGNLAPKVEVGGLNPNVFCVELGDVRLRENSRGTRLWWTGVHLRYLCRRWYQRADMLHPDPAQPVRSREWVIWARYPRVIKLGPPELRLSKMYQGADVLLDPGQVVRLV